MNATLHQSRSVVSAVGIALALLVAPLAAQPAFAAADEICYSRQDLAARSAGFVVRVAVRDAQEVRKGDLLIELDNRLHRAAVREAKAAVAAARAGLDLAQDSLRRLKKMAGSDSVSPQELFGAEIQAQQAQAQHDQARAALERATIALEDTMIRAEIDGRVSGLPLVKNLYVQAGQSLGRIEAAAAACAAAK